VTVCFSISISTAAGQQHIARAWWQFMRRLTVVVRLYSTAIGWQQVLRSRCLALGVTRQLLFKTLCNLASVTESPESL
jgi:hypothetical protein